MPSPRIAACVLSFLFVTTASLAVGHANEGSVGGVLGYQFDLEAPLLGIDARYSHGVADSVDLLVQGQGNYFFLDSQEAFGTSVDATVLQFDVTVGGQLAMDWPVAPYAGIGPALVHSNTTVRSGDREVSSESTTDMGFNTIFGAALILEPPIRPFAQLRVTFLDGTTASLLMGVNYVFY